MSFKGHLLGGTAAIPGLRMTAAERAKGRYMRAPDHPTGEGGNVDPPEGETDDQKAAREAAEAAAAAAGKTNTDAAKALKDAQDQLAALQEQLKQFEGVDPKKAKDNEKKIADAEAAAAAAKKAAKEAEKAQAAAENDVAKLAEIQAAEHKAELDRIVTERDAARNEVQTVTSQLNQVRVENAFANSKFINEETILTGAKAQRLFADYVDVVDGQVVVYDAPRGDEKRAKVMDSKGKALSFNEAITKVIGADPDKDSLLKSKVTPGAGSSTTNNGKPAQPATSRHSRLTAGIAALREKNAR